MTVLLNDLFLDIWTRGILHNPSAICSRPWRRQPRWSRLGRGHQLHSGSEVVNGMKPTIVVVSESLADDKNSDDNDEPGGPKKRGRPSVSRVPGGAQSTKWTCRSPAMRTRKQDINASKAAGRGAERLVSMTAQGIHQHLLSGLHVPQGSVGVLEQEQPSWIVGREVVDTRRDAESTGPQQIVLQENAKTRKNYKKSLKICRRGSD